MAAFTRDEIQSRFGRFGYREIGEGRIEPNAAWAKKSIVSITPPWPLPIGGGRTVRQIRCHRLVAQSLTNALQELQDVELEHLIKTFDGCYVPRHVGWNPQKPLSTHSWGIAIDLNAPWFPFGRRLTQDARLVRCMARHGFACGQPGGGLWRVTCDAMHFEYTFRGE